MFVFRSSGVSALLVFSWLWGNGWAWGEGERARRGAVHPGRNVEEFSPVEARFLRFTVRRTTSNAQPCLDELEAYGPAAPLRNLALAAEGTRVRASGSLPEYRIHTLPHVHDGLYGNGHSWISDTAGSGWVEFEFPSPVVLDRVVWSRDRERKFIDRLAVEYDVEVAVEPGRWRMVASSADREWLPALPAGTQPYMAMSGHFAATATELSVDGYSAAGEYLLETWQTSRGLPSNTVTAVTQTRDGWLWVGTSNGLARFDGLRFTTFGERHGLPSLSVTCLLEDSRGVLWVGTEGGGLVRWEDGKFHALEIGEGLAARTVLSLAEDAAGVLWVATPAGLHYWRDGRLTRCVEGLAASLVAGQDGVWFIAGGSEMVRWNGREVVKAPGGLDPSRFSAVSALSGGTDGAMWFGGANGYVGRLAAGAVTTFGEGHQVLASSTRELLPTPGGDVWVGTSASGLARLREGALLQITTDDGLGANCVGDLCLDREGVLWVGTIGGGLSCLRPRRIEAVTTRDGLSHNGVMAMAEDAVGTLWIGTNGGGLNRLAAGSRQPGPHSPSYVLENRVISSLAAMRDGSLWLGTSTEGVFRIKEGAVQSIGLEDGLPGRIVTSLAEDVEGGLWVGTLDGGVCYVRDGRVEPLPEPGVPAGLPVTSLLVDRSGRLWVGTAGQGVVCREAGGTLVRWTRDHGLPSQFIRTFREDAGGTMWAGTSGGLVRWAGGRLFSFTRRHGLLDEVISQILDDGAGHLWLGTNQGVLRVTIESLERVASGRAAMLDVLALGTSDGLPGLECTGGYHPAGVRLRDGRLCFGTVAGLAMIDPQSFAPRNETPPVVIESISSPGGPFMNGEESAVVVPPGADARLGFQFTALSFLAPGRVRFQCRLDGLDAGWVDAGGERSMAYAPLSPGAYRFEVRASADGGPWSRPAAVAVKVAAPWWRHPAVGVGGGVSSLILAAGLARALTRRRLQRRLQLAEQQVGLERERTRIARDIHDDLGANLTQISLLSAVGREQRDQPDVVEAKFAAITTVAGELVQALDAIVWAVNPRHDTLESLARYLVRFSSDLCVHAPVRLRLDVPAELPHVLLGSDVRHALFLAAKEALHNSLQHAGASEIRLQLAVDAGLLTLSLSDDGCGFVPEPATGVAVAGVGNGVHNMRQRLAEIGGRCEITSAPEKGAHIVFSLPCSPLP